ncbi:MAG: hypothetical protein AAFY52_00705 [Pseudomonadota bacterium]
MWQAVDVTTVMYGVYDSRTGNPQETVFQNPAGSPFLSSGEMAKFKTPDQGKTEARAIFSMGDAPPFSQGGIP